MKWPALGVLLLALMVVFPLGFTMMGALFDMAFGAAVGFVCYKAWLRFEAREEDMRGRLQAAERKVALLESSSSPTPRTNRF